MKITAPKKSLAAALGHCAGVADKRSTIAICSNVLLRADDSGLTASATNLATSVKATVAGATVVEPGATTVPAAAILARVRAMPEGDVTITVTDGEAMAITAKGSSRRYKLVGLAADDFPTLPEPSGDVSCDISAATLASLLGRTAWAADADPSRTNVSGVYFESVAGSGRKKGSTLEMVATDGQQGAFASVYVKGSPLPAWVIMMPTRSATEMRKLMVGRDGDVRFATDGKHMFIGVDGLGVSARLLDHTTFPPLKSIIDRMGIHSTGTASVGQLNDAMKAMAIVATEGDIATSGLVIIDAQADHMLVTTDSAGGSAGGDRIPFDIDTPGRRVGLSVNFVFNVLNSFGDENEVTIRFTDAELGPVIFEPTISDKLTKHWAIVMPRKP